MARFNASALRAKASQAQSKLRAAQSQLQRASRQLQNDARRLQSDARRAQQQYRRSVAELERTLRSARTGVVVVTRVEWEQLTYSEQRQLQDEANMHRVELRLSDDESDVDFGDD